MTEFSLPVSSILPDPAAHEEGFSPRGVPIGSAGVLALTERQAYRASKYSCIMEMEHSASANNVLHRPGGMGVSTFASCLRTYYDVASQDIFDRVFPQSMTHREVPNHSSFAILDFDFAYIEFMPVSRIIAESLRSFAAKYGLADYVPESGDDIAVMFLSFFAACQKNRFSLPIYVIAENYDTFSYSDPLGKNPARKIPHSVYRVFFTMLQKAENQGLIARIFVSGIMPVCNTFASHGITFNFRDISFASEFAGIAGFTEKDVGILVKDIFMSDRKQDINCTPEEFADTLIGQLDGYSFCPDTSIRIMNPRTVLQCLNLLFTNVQNGFSDVKNSRISRLLNAVKTDYSINITQIDQDLRKKGFCFSGVNFNMGYELETQKFIELMYFAGVLTIRDVENEYGKSPVINLRLANAYVTELWRNATGI